MKVTIHETYEYEVEAETVEQAQAMFDEYMQNGDSDTTGVTFNQNYPHFYDTEGKEL